MPMNKKETTEVFNPFTGTYRTVSDDEAVEKGSKSKWPSLTKRDNSDEAGGDEEEDFEKSVPIFFDKAKDEHIVYGIVYAPDEVDSQGDQASAEEIKKAAYDFMEHCQTFKVMHKGKPADIKVLESYIAPQKLTVSGRTIKKGSWVISARINNKKVWKDVKTGKLTGFSMAGYAKVETSDN